MDINKTGSAPVCQFDYHIAHLAQFELAEQTTLSLHLNVTPCLIEYHILPPNVVDVRVLDFSHVVHDYICDCD